jgi:hypothetical protein
MEVSTSQDRTNHQGPKDHEESIAKSWIVVFSIAVFFFLWGLLIFYTVGVGSPPSWQYGVVPDVPGQSVFSVQGAEERSGTALFKDETIPKQHIMGRPKETGKPQGKEG